MRIFRLHVFWISTVFSANLAHAADQLTVFGRTLPVTEYAISKSTSGRLLNIFNSDPLSDAKSSIKGVYVPAGTRLAILDFSYDDIQGRQWNLASSDQGLLLFIKNTQYFSTDIIDKKLKNSGDHAVAFVQSKLTIPTTQYKDVTLTPSEMYIAEEAADETVNLRIDQAKMGKQWIADETVTVPESAVALLSDKAFAKKEEILSPFLPYDAIKEVKSLFEKSLEEKSPPDISTLRKKGNDFIESQFLTNKMCESEIKYDLTGFAELGLDMSAWISPVTAQLKLTGNISASVSYPQNTEFQVRRVTRNEKVYEIKTDVVRPDCGSPPSAVKTVVSFDGSRGELTGADSPIYSCRDEYFGLRDILANKYSLPAEISAFVVANVSEFRGASDPTLCAKP